MSQFYNGFKNQLLQWALGEKPAGVKMRVMAVGEDYVFNPADLTIPPEVIISDVEVAPNLNNTTVSFGSYVLRELPVSEFIQGFVVYFKWPTGVKLICFVDSATDNSLPLQIEQPELQVRWNAAGVFRI